MSQDNDFATGLQPGDLTKYMALPWQSDFNECTTQPINITYADWNNLWPDGDNDERLRKDEKTWTTLWWPAHRPLQTFEIASFDGRKGQPSTYVWTTWSRGVPQTRCGRSQDGHRVVRSSASSSATPISRAPTHDRTTSPTSTSA